MEASVLQPTARAGLARISKGLAAGRREYSKQAKIFLAAHPLCQIFMAKFRIDERLAIAELRNRQERGVPTGCNGDCLQWGWDIDIPFATEIHHRNKRNGRERLLNQSYWMAASRHEHEWAEGHKDEARAIGILCPINARPDGTLPDDSRCLTTNELLDLRARQINKTTI